MAHYLCRKSLRILQSECLSPLMGSLQIPPGINTTLQLLKVKLALLPCKLIWCNWIWNGLQCQILVKLYISDLPVYALTKEIQLCHPEIFSQYFPIFRQLHIEQSLLVIHGQLIEAESLLNPLFTQKEKLNLKTYSSTLLDIYIYIYIYIHTESQ